MRDLALDVRYALRSLVKTPAVTGVALTALALGIGANTAIFSVAHAVLWSPLAYPEPEELVILIDHNLEAGLPRFSSSPPDFADWREQNRVFEELGAFTRAALTLTGEGGEPERLAGLSVSGELFDVYGLEPALGRAVTPEDDRPGAPKVVVISHGLWQRRFGGEPGIVGRTLRLDGEPHTVVGVAPERLDFPADVDLWVPMAMADVESLRGAHFIRVIGRLKEGVTRTAAQAEMNVLSRRLAEAYPDTNTGWGVDVLPLQEYLVEDVRPALLVLLVTVALVLAIACANVANVLLAKNAARQREMALRSTLGAGRGRLLRQLLVESVVLAVAGGALGLLLAAWGTRVLLAANADAVPRSAEVGLDPWVLGFTLALSVAAGLLFGLAPAIAASRVDLSSSLKEEDRGAAGGRGARWARGILVLFEVAAAVILLVGAGLLLRSLRGLAAVDPGFEPAGVLTAEIGLPELAYPEEIDRGAFYRELLPRLSALPGAEAAGIGFPLPLGGGNYILTFTVRGRPIPGPNEYPNAGIRFVSPGYLEALRVPLIRGRTFTAADGAEAPAVVLVNQTLVRTMWPGEDPLGQHVTFDDPAGSELEWAEVVGVVGDVLANELAGEPAGEIYRSLLQEPMGFVSLVVRGAVEPAALAGPLRQAVGNLDREIAVEEVKPLEQVVAESLAAERFRTSLLALFAILALVLAATGVYGVISYGVSQRTREMGLRLALGAHRREVLGMVVRQGMVPVVAGLALGLIAAWLLTRLLQGFLFGVTATDPLTFVAVPLVLAAVGLAASLVPARRATRVDPLVALKVQ